MKMLLETLTLDFKKSVESIPLGHITFFWGKIGAGKSSIARLIDYCLGGSLTLTPALQEEFIQASLDLVIGSTRLTIYRERESNKVTAVWTKDEITYEVNLPARNADGVVIPETKVEVLSDLLFHLSEIDAPLVRKGKKSDESRLERLSFRDLFRYCYLDQDDMDSNFFFLDGEDWARKHKSLDAIRYILGYHQDRVAVLEIELQEVHEQKLAARAAAAALQNVLIEAGFSDPERIESNIEQLRQELVTAKAGVANLRSGLVPNEHATDALRRKARDLTLEISSREEAAYAIKVRSDEITRHLNELRMLSVRFSRTNSARAILAGADFHSCPRCTQPLPTHRPNDCSVCGQPEPTTIDSKKSIDTTSTDVRSRIIELEETLLNIKSHESFNKREIDSLRQEKLSIDKDLSKALEHYDSIFSSQILESERRVIRIDQQISSLLKYRELPKKLQLQFSSVEEFQKIENQIKASLTSAREAAFKDRENLIKLQKIFLDCLVRSSFPGINSDFIVRINPKTLVPELSQSEDSDYAITSYSNMGSGGMKGIFKACYALALHRLAVEIGANLPTIIVLDSAMKNVSERENADLFSSFFRLIYELAAGELKETQFILIDKEFCEIPEDIEVEAIKRHMAPYSSEHPPLIPYFRMEDLT